jgi:hypothetical protein
MSAAQPLSKAARSRASAILSVRLRNLLIGALLGALVMLLALPASRPYYLGLLSPSALDRSLASTAAFAKGNVLTDTRSLEGHAMLFHHAASPKNNRRAVTDQELAKV